MKGVRGIFTERDILGKEKGYGNKKRTAAGATVQFFKQTESYLILTTKPSPWTALSRERPKKVL